MGFLQHLPLLLLLLSLASVSAQMTGDFKCQSPATCRALVGFTPANSTTYAALQALFTVKNLRSILGANNLPLSTPRDATVPANQTIRIPIPCSCSNGTGISNRVPIYTIQKGNTLFSIASIVYGDLLRYERIAEVNNITNPNIIIEGQKLWIPLPCSCDKVDGQDVVHYNYVVKSGSSTGEIAAQFGTDNQTLLTLNGIANDSQLLADYPFDVPLRACNTSVKNDSPDYPLLVANGSYVFTANSCVRCSCDASNNWTLKCEPSQLTTSKQEVCPSMQCAGSENLLLGNTTTGSCGPATCSYAGFSNGTIDTTLLPQSTCAAPNNHASTIQKGWNFLFVSSQLVLLSLHLL